MMEEQFEMRAPKEFSGSIGEWRRQQPDFPSRAGAIGRLCENAFAAMQRPKRKAG